MTQYLKQDGSRIVRQHSIGDAGYIFVLLAASVSLFLSLGCPALADPPERPSILAPVCGSLNAAIKPRLDASDFTDSASDIHQASQWQLRQLNSASDYSSTLYDSGATTLSLTSFKVPAGVLKYSESVACRVRYQDNNSLWSAWSGDTTFTINNGCYQRVNTYEMDWKVADVLLDDTRGRFWVLRPDDNCVAAYDIDSGDLVASIATGVQPTVFAITYDRRYLGVGSSASVYLTVIDLDSDLSEPLGFYDTGNTQNVTQVSAIGTSDLILSTSGPSHGWPPIGGRVEVWHGDSRTIEQLPGDVGDRCTLCGLPPTDKFLLGPWYYTDWGIDLVRYDRGLGTKTTLSNCASPSQYIINDSTMFGADSVNNQLLIWNRLIDIKGDALSLRTMIGFGASDVEPIFNPANSNQVIISGQGSPTLQFWNLTTLQQDFALPLPQDKWFVGRGEFGRDGAQLLILARRMPYPNREVVYYGPPLVNPFWISSPADQETEVPVMPCLKVSAINFPERLKHQASQWQIRGEDSPSDYSVIVFDSGPSSVDPTSVTIPAGGLNYHRPYAARMRYQENNGVWSDWTDEIHFSTTYLGSLIPIPLSPENGATGVSITPTLIASPFCGPGPAFTHMASQWQVRKIDTPTNYSNTVLNTGEVPGNLTSITLPVGALQYSTTYCWRVRYVDNVGNRTAWSEEAEFTVAPCQNALAPFIPVRDQIEDALLDETRNRCWILRKSAALAEAYDIDTGERVASIHTGADPVSMAMTYNKRYLGVACYSSPDFSVIDLEANPPREIGPYVSKNGDNLFRVTAIGTSDLLFVTYPYSPGCPPQGGRLHVWHGDTRLLDYIDRENGSHNLIGGFPPSNKFMLGALGYSEGGIALASYVPSSSSIYIYDEYMTGVTLGLNSLFQVDPIHNQLIIHQNLLRIQSNELILYTILPQNYENSQPIFSPTNSNLAVVSPSGGQFINLFDLSISANSATLSLPNGLTWAGKGQFRADGKRLLVVVNGSPNNGLVWLTMPFANPYSIVEPSSGQREILPGSLLIRASASAPAADGHRASWWQVRETSSPLDYSVSIFDSGPTQSLTSTTIPAGLLKFSKTYAIRMCYQTNLNLWSNWSVESLFTTAMAPDRPMNISPSNGAVRVSLTPILQASGFSCADLGHFHDASQWQIREANMPADYSVMAYDSGTTRQLSSFLVTTGTLRYYMSYKWRTRYKDDRDIWSNWSAETSFTTTKTTDEEIVFEENGHICVMKADGSQATALTAGLAHDSSPRFNHSGTRIAFSSDRGGRYRIWTMNPDGSDLKPVNGFDSANPIFLAYSPDDQKFVVTALGDAFSLVNADGSGATTLARHTMTQGRQADWGVTNKIAMALSPAGNAAATSIRTINSNGAGDTQVLADGAMPRWARDGASLFYAQGGDLWRCNADGASPQRLSNTSDDLESEVVPSADGSRIFYRSCPKTNPGVSTICVANADGSSTHSITYANTEIHSLDVAVVQLGSNQRPAQPTNLSPVNSTVTSLVPTLQASAFSDPDTGDTHASTQWQVRLWGEDYDQAVVNAMTTTELVSYQVEPAALVPGQLYAWRVRYFDNGGNASPWSAEATFRTPNATIPSDKVLIVAGGGDYLGNPIVDQTKFLSGYAYRMSRNRQVPENQILFLSAFPVIDAEGTGANSVDTSATRTAFLGALDSSVGWAADTNKLIIYLADHGSRQGQNHYFKINPTETVSAAELDATLDALQADHPAMEIAVVCDFCYSGGFVLACQPTSGQKRICVSGSTDASLAIFSGPIAGVSFSNFLFDSLSAGANLKTAFDTARDGILTAYVGPPSSPQQVPWLEDNYDDYVSDKADGELARDFYWGSTRAFGATPPNILTVTPDQVLPKGTTAWKLSVTLAQGHTIQRVWANIIPPDAQYVTDQPITDMRQIELVREGSSQTWSAVYDKFWTRGTFRAVFFARGHSGDSSLVMTSTPRVTAIQVPHAVSTANDDWMIYR